MTELKNAYRKFLIASDDLAAHIRSGEFVGGKPFMKRSEICEKYGISPVTAHRVQQELVKRGLLISRKGLPFIVRCADEYTLPELKEIVYVRQVPTYETGKHGSMIMTGIREVAEKHQIATREIYLELLDRNYSRIDTTCDCDVTSGLVLMPYRSIMVRGAGYFLKPGLRRVVVETPFAEYNGVFMDNLDGVETLLGVAKEQGAKSVMVVGKRMAAEGCFADGEIFHFCRGVAEHSGLILYENHSPVFSEIKQNIIKYRPDALFFLSSHNLCKLCKEVIPQDKMYKPLLMTFARSFDNQDEISEQVFRYECDAFSIGRVAAEMLINARPNQIVSSEYIKGKLIKPKA